MFNNQTFPHEAEDDSDLQTFINIRKSKLYKVATHVVVFPCAKAISWIVRHVRLETRYILNSKEHPIASFEASTITSCYHLENREIIERVIAQFVLVPKEKVKGRKIGVTGGYPITVTST
jgi:hypothetical protein